MGETTRVLRSDPALRPEFLGRGAFGASRPGKTDASLSAGGLRDARTGGRAARRGRAHAHASTRVARRCVNERRRKRPTRRLVPRRSSGRRRTPRDCRVRKRTLCRMELERVQRRKDETLEPRSRRERYQRGVLRGESRRKTRHALHRMRSHREAVRVRARDSVLDPIARLRTRPDGRTPRVSRRRDAIGSRLRDGDHAGGDGVRVEDECLDARGIETDGFELRAGRARPDDILRVRRNGGGESQRALLRAQRVRDETTRTVRGRRSNPIVTRSFETIEEAHGGTRIDGRREQRRDERRDERRAERGSAYTLIHRDIKFPTRAATREGREDPSASAPHATPAADSRKPSPETSRTLTRVS